MCVMFECIYVVGWFVIGIVSWLGVVGIGCGVFGIVVGYVFVVVYVLF